MKVLKILLITLLSISVLGLAQVVEADEEDLKIRATARNNLRNIKTPANQAVKEQLELIRTLGSEKVDKDGELFLLMQKNLTQLKKDYQEMIVDVNDLVKNGQPVKRMGF